MDGGLMNSCREDLSADKIGLCAEAHCGDHGGFRAPIRKRADGEIAYGIFCKIHARERNGKWNYFVDMDADEIEDFRHQSYSWHKKISDNLSQSALTAALRSTEFLGDDALFAASGISGNRTQSSNLPAEIKRALAQMELEDMPDEVTLKTCFRQLAKRYHPDVQPENSRNLERLQNINAAYKMLKEYLRREISIEPKGST